MSGFDDAAAFDAEVAPENPGDGFRIDAMFFGEYAERQSFQGVVVENGNGGLQKNGAAVEIFIDKMNCTSGYFHSVLEGLVLGVESGEGGKQRRMDVQDLVRKLRNEATGEKAHVTGETDEVDLVLVKQGGNLGVEFGAVHSRRRDAAVRQAEFTRFGETGCIGAICKNEPDLAAEVALQNIPGDGFEIGTAAG